MSSMVIDTLKFVDKLKAAGFSEQQSRAVVEGFHSVDLDHLATKSDLAELKLATQGDLKAGLAELKAEILKWMLGQAALIVTLIKLL